MDDLTDILQIYLIVVCIWLVVASFTLISIVKRNDMRLPLKIFWCVIIIAAPVLGLIIYLIYSHNRDNRA